MTRFDAATPEDRRSLIADALVAHRERESLFCTVEADELPSSVADQSADTGRDGADSHGTDGDETGGEETGDDGEPAASADDVEADEDAEDATPAWIQYSEREGQLNLDCTDEEYERLTAVLGDFPAFTIEAQDSPEDAEGRNLRVAARGDDERVAQLVDRLFVEGFGYEDDFRLWTTEL